MLELKQLTVGYSGPRGAVLSDQNLAVSPGSFICVLGRNGAGKSTLMRTISGLQPALAGAACLRDDDIAALRPQTRAQRIAVVLTERIASPGLTVDDVVAMGRTPFTDWRGRLSTEDRKLVTEALELARATPFSGRLFDDLSDGERQRVMIARAIAQTPQLMVLDEITAFLDLPGRVETMALLRDHARSSGSIVLLSSHDLDLSLQLADSVWLLDGTGGMRVGSASELIEAGDIGRAFDTPAVHFSRELGRFELVA
ncbi:ABC transporter ATP-binding protein [Altericroceibacterium endophyticum]|uniref:ATP-binding cassette domain-containing protein n=1 Tax=Altericroceibacterium endophyticum TaxID=1808508 RepID=A0A6I4T7N6_9SPHN|nr:ABC transporter ATP-binding protein [Altericroceibacterium endophyticum]MXO66698.1 ATP-binding cassette domain-containing protein [Altericroceibacterium endophyticum]